MATLLRVMYILRWDSGAVKAAAVEKLGWVVQALVKGGDHGESIGDAVMLFSYLVRNGCHCEVEQFLPELARLVDE